MKFRMVHLYKNPLTTDYEQEPNKLIEMKVAICFNKKTPDCTATIRRSKLNKQTIEV